MKTIRKGILILLVCVFSLAMGSFMAACGKKVTVSFDTDGAGEIASQTVKAGEEVILPNGLTKEGYVFDGWYDNSKRTGTEYRNRVQVNEDVTFYAKWVQGVDLTLDLDGGVYDGEESITLKAGVGKSILDARWQGTAVRDMRPIKEEVDFGAWFDENGNQISETSLMPAQNCTIKAKYTVVYTVEIRKQTEPYGTEYEIDDEAYITENAFVDEPFNVPIPKVENYEFNSRHEGNVTNLTMSRTISQNAFILYFNRETYHIIYDSNAPDGVEVTGKMRDGTFVYGEQGVVGRNKYEIKGYRFAGWSTTASGEVTYQAGAEIENGNHKLFAIWDRGYRDILGGTDFIYFPRTYGGKVILLRAGHEFEGTRKNLNADGTYTDAAEGQYIEFGNNLIAKLDSKNMTFVFYHKDWTQTYKHISTYEDSDPNKEKNATLKLDGFETGTLTEDGVEKKISYYFDEETSRYMLEVENERKPRGFIFGLKDEDPVFTFLGEEVGEHLIYQRTGINGYLPTEFSVLFDGVGSVSLCDAETGDPVASGVYYTPTEIGSGEATHPLIKSIIEGETYEFYLMDFRSSDSIIPGAMLKDDLIEGTYTGKDGQTLEVSGFNGYNGAVKLEDSNGTEHNYDYYSESTVLGYILHVLTEDPTKGQKEEMTLMLKESTENNERKLSFDEYVSFSQYRLLLPSSSSTNGISAGLVLVVYDAEGKEVTYTDTFRKLKEGSDEEFEDVQVELHGYKAEIYGDGERLMEGHVTEGADAVNYVEFKVQNFPLKHFEATLTSEEEEKLKNNPMALGFYSSFEYQTVSLVGAGETFYVYLNRTKIVQNGTFNYAVYGNEDDTERMLITNDVLGTVRGSGFEGRTAYYFREDGSYLEGSMEQMPSSDKLLKAGIVDTMAIYGFFYYDKGQTLQELYFGIYSKKDEAGRDVGYWKFFKDAPRFMSQFRTTTVRAGVTTMWETYPGMVFTGDGETAYYYPTANAYETNSFIKGKYQEIGKATLGSTKYLFTPDDQQKDGEPFEFIHELVYSGKGFYNDYFRLAEKRWEGFSTTLEDGSTVSLDGFGHYAKFTSASGETLEGNYIFFQDSEKNYTQCAIYEYNGGTSVSVLGGLSTDKDGNFISLKPEERADYYYLWGSDYWFPAEFDQVAVIFDSREHTFTLPEYGDWRWYLDYQNGDTHEKDGWDYHDYFKHMHGTGTYEVLDEDDLIYLLHVELMSDGSKTGQTRDLICRMQFNGNEGILIIQDDNIFGSYVGPENEVVYIDGYGLSFYVDEFGNRRDGVYTFISDNPNDKNYNYVAFDDGDICYVMIFNQSERTFQVGNNPEKFLTFYSNEFDAVEYTEVYSVDGEAIGYWFFDSSDGNKFKVYKAEFTNEYGWNYVLASDITYPENADSITLNNKQYFKHEQGKTYSLKGSVVFDAFVGRGDLNGGNDNSKWGDMTLDFTPDGSNALNAPAVLHFKHDNETVDYSEYTIRKELVSVLQNKVAQLTRIYQKNVPYGFRLELIMKPTDKQEGFTFHAAAIDTSLIDYNVAMYDRINYLTVTMGRNYSIGAKSWPISTWGIQDNDLVVSLLFNLADKKNKILATDVLFSENFEEAKTDTQTADATGTPTKKTGHKITEDYPYDEHSPIPVWEVVFKGSDGYNYSAWIELFTGGSGRYFLLYCFNIKVEIEGKIGQITETGTEEKTDGADLKITAQIFQCAYWGGVDFESIYQIGITKKGENGQEGESLITDESLGSWVDDLIVIYTNETVENDEHNSPKEQQKNAYVIKVERNTDNVITKARVDESKYEIVKSSKMVAIEAKTEGTTEGQAAAAADGETYADWYFGFVNGYGYDTEKKKDMIKKYLVFAAIFDTKTGKYVPVVFDQRVTMTTANDKTIYTLKYHLPDTTTPWTATIELEKGENGTTTAKVYVK